jgi:hypothetical protein
VEKHGPSSPVISRFEVDAGGFLYLPLAAVREFLAHALPGTVGVSWNAERKKVKVNPHMTKKRVHPAIAIRHLQVGEQALRQPPGGVARLVPFAAARVRPISRWAPETSTVPRQLTRGRQMATGRHRQSPPRFARINHLALALALLLIAAEDHDARLRRQLVQYAASRRFTDAGSPLLENTDDVSN